MKQSNKSFSKTCDICRVAGDRFNAGKGEGPAMANHPACGVCGLLLGPGHTSSVASTCGTCGDRAAPTREEMGRMVAAGAAGTSLTLHEFQLRVDYRYRLLEQRRATSAAA